MGDPRAPSTSNAEEIAGRKLAVSLNVDKSPLPHPPRRRGYNCSPVPLLADNQERPGARHYVTLRNNARV